MVLATLRREGEPHQLPVTRIAQLVLQPTGGISQRIDRLERRGLVTRSLATDDRRKVLVQLTADGLDVAVRGGRSYDRVRQRVLADVPEAERAEIDAAVRALFAAMERDATDHAG